MTRMTIDPARASGPLVPVFSGGRAHLLAFDVRAGVDPTKVSMGDILEVIGAKDPTPIGHWRTLSADEYTRAFAVARTAGYGIIRDIYDALNAAFANGETADQFADRLLPLLRSRGWLGGKGVPQRLELIYDTNLRVARGAGRWERYRRTAAAFPYLRGVTARDERVRHPPRSPLSDHRAFDGLILPVSHPFWSRWFVPLGFRCRCSVIQMTRSQLARYRGGVTSEEELAQREARLGEPIFAPPGSFDAQLAKIASVANDARVPGQPAFSLVGARMTGQRLLQAQLLEEGIDEIADVLNRIFGQAA